MTARVPRRTRRQLLLRTGRRCEVCHQHRRLEVHHVVPRIRGGTNHISNLRLLCRRCHLRVHRVDQVIAPDN